MAQVNTETHRRIAEQMFLADHGRPAASEDELAQAGYLDLKTRDDALPKAHTETAKAEKAAQALTEQ